MQFFYQPTAWFSNRTRLLILALLVGLATLPSQAQTTWTGNTNADWNTAGNWSAGVPTTTLDAIIPNVTPSPTIGAGTSAVANWVGVESGATLTIASSATLAINKDGWGGVGAFQNAGTVENSGQLLIGNLDFMVGAGILNTGTFTNNAGGRIQIDRTESIGLYNREGTFTNNGTITIGALGSLGLDGLQNQATFINNTGGTIQIDRTLNGTGVNNLSTFTNSATITIGSLGSISKAGIYNSFGTFTNDVGGRIQIDQSTNSGLNNTSGGTFINSATIVIGSNASGSVGSYGLVNQGSFNNNTGGGLQIDRSTFNGIYNLVGGTFTNTATIKIGSIVSIGSNGIHTAGEFNNNAGGTIQIDRSTFNGIFNTTTGTFTNAAMLTIGSIAAAGTYGISTEGTFNNNTGGTIQIDRTTTGLTTNGPFTNAANIKIGSLTETGVSGISISNTFKNISGGNIQIDRTTNYGLYNGGTFTNEALMTIGASMATYGIINVSTINNNCGGVIHTEQIINNRSGTFTNSGSIIEKASGNSSISSNSGLVQNLNGGDFTITTNTGKLTTTAGTYWTGCTSTNWATASNWSTGVVPTTSDDAVILSGTPNQPTIGASTAAVANLVEVQSGATLTIASSATLAINKEGDGLWAFLNAGTVENSGQLLIGNLNFMTDGGIRNNGTFTNNAGGRIQIDRTESIGLYNREGTFTNNGTITIGALGPIGSNGLENRATFINNTGGTIQIDRTPNEYGLANHRTFTNSATITIGSLGSIGMAGLYSSFGTFTNDVGGRIQIDRSTNSGLENSSGGTFINSATIVIGSNTTISGIGLHNEATFTNKAGGIIQIDRSSSAGLNSSDGTFDNAGTVSIGAATSGLENIPSGAFHNQACGVLTTLGKITNSSSFTNTGLMTVNTLQAHSNTVSLTNNGIIVYPQGNPIPNVTNNDLIVNSFSVCQAATPILQIGGSNSFQAGSTWYKDESLTQAAGTYDQGTNTFTKTDLTGGSSHTLYFSINDTGNSCARTVSIPVTVNAAPSLTITANPSFTITSGNNVMLTASGATSYTWSTGETTTSITVSPTTSTVYSLTGLSAQCSATTSQTVTVLNPASATLSGSTTLCPGQPATLSVALTGTPPWSLTYTDGTTPVGLSGITSSPYTFPVNPGNTTTYALLGVASSEAPTGGTVSGSATVTRNTIASAPVLTPLSQSVIQNTPFVTLSISGCPGALNWSASNSTSGTGNIISVPTSATATIVYSATCVSSCPTPPGSATVTIAPPTTTGNFDGFVNGADCSSFRGWAWDRSKGNTVYTIEILDGSTSLGTLAAGDFRQDLLDAGKGNGKHAFRFTIPESIKDGLSHNLSARIAGSSFILKDSPKALICQGGTTPPANKQPIAPSPTVLIAPLAAQVGVPFSGTLAAFTDPEGQPLSYGLSGLPGSLSINPGNRMISGTPSEAGDFVLTYTATDPQGATNSVSFVLTVSAPQTTTVAGSFEGYLDKVECGTIRGWVWDRNKPNTPVTVEFYTGSTVWGSVVANIYRVDLKNAGKGNGAHAYSFDVPAALKDGTSHLIYGRVQGSTFVLKDSGKPLTCNVPVRLSAETESDLQVTVLGNPVLGTALSVEVRGAEGQPLRLQLTDLQGRMLSTRQIDSAQTVERQTFVVQHQPPGLLLLRVTNGLKSVTVKVLR